MVAVLTDSHEIKHNKLLVICSSTHKIGMCQTLNFLIACEPHSKPSEMLLKIVSGIIKYKLLSFCESHPSLTNDQVSLRVNL